MAELRVTELDYFAIRQNLKNFLASQDEFSDYDFEGSAMSVLLDTLAYNTHYNAIFSHLVANEMFLDSAVKRASILSLAKSLGYTPRSATGARANVDIEVVAPVGFSGNTISLPNTTIFVGTSTPTNTNTSGKFSFVPLTDYTGTVISQSGGQKTFLISDVTLIEGTRLNKTVTVDTAITSGPIVIPNPRCDTSSITVDVINSSSDPTTVQWSAASNYLNIDNDSKVFWVEETADGLVQLVFGDDVIGKKLEVGNIVIIDYVVSNGKAANGINQFTNNTVFAGSGETKTYTVNNRASNGRDRETIDEIRFRAPKFNATRDRAVTKDDYKTLIEQNFSVNSVTVWGGEENDPPIYGRVFICLDPVAGSVITEADRDTIAREIIGPRGIVSIQPNFVDPEYTYIKIDSTVRYDPRFTTRTSTQIESAVRTIIDDHCDLNLNKLAASFYFSKLSAEIQSDSSAYLTNELDVTLSKRFSSLLNSVNYKLDPNFHVQLEPNTLFSTRFTTVLGGQTKTVYIDDVPDVNPPDPEGTGTLVLKEYLTDSVLSTNFGTVNYLTGKIVIPDINVSSLLGGATNLRIYVKPQNSTTQISSRVLTSTQPGDLDVQYVSRNTILKQDTSNVNDAAGIPPGTTVDIEAQ